MLRPGEQVGNYRVEGLIGRGGQGIVYRAAHVHLGTAHALKLLLVDVGPLRDRLLDEGRIQARLKSPHVVPVTDAVEIEGGLALVAEYVPGAPLDAWVAAVAPSLGTRLALFRDICRGVAAAHAARIVHRDLKPANVLVELRDGQPLARVTDFGVAKVLDDARARGTLPGMALGTPGYMAPEQLKDAATVDARADVFALGCLLHELLGGERPWPEIELVPYAAAVDTQPPAVLRVPGLPADEEARIATLAAACLAREPDQRPPDATAVLALLDGTPLATPARTPVLRTPTVVPAALPPTVPDALPSMAPPPDEDPWAEPAPRPARRLAIVALVAALSVGGAVAGTFGVFGAGEPVVAASIPIEAPAPLDAAGPVAVAPATAPSTASVDSRPSAPEARPTAPDAPIPRPEGATMPPEGATTPPEGATTPPEGATSPPVVRPTTPAITLPATDPPAPTTGRVILVGDGELVRLQAGKSQYPPTAAPPGTYTVVTRFGAEGEVPAGYVTVKAGVTSRVRCVAQALRCTPEAP